MYAILKQYLSMQAFNANCQNAAVNMQKILMEQDKPIKIQLAILLNESDKLDKMIEHKIREIGGETLKQIEAIEGFTFEVNDI